MQHLWGAVTAQSAPAYVLVAGRLGLVKVREAAMRVAAAGLGKIAAGACDGLPLEAMEQLLGMAKGSGAGAGGARGRILASYMRVYDGGGRMDEEAYRRLMRRHSASAGQDAGGRAVGVGPGTSESHIYSAPNYLLIVELQVGVMQIRPDLSSSSRGVSTTA